MQVTPTITGENPLTAAPMPLISTYRDETGGFEMDYPASWSVVDVTPEAKEQSSSYSITLMSWTPQEPGSQGIPEGGSKIDVSVTKGTGASLEGAIGSRREELAAGDSAAQITFEEPWNLPGGLAGIHLTVQSSQGETVHELVTAINGNRIVLSGLGDAGIFEQIAMTLRPASLLDPKRAVNLVGSGPGRHDPSRRAHPTSCGADGGCR